MMKRTLNLILLRKSKINFLILSCFFFFLSSLNAQAQNSVRGVVKDMDGETLIGVNVKVKDTKQGTLTDANGEFILNLSNSNATLEFSYVGYAPKSVALQGKKFIEVLMEQSSQALDEIVVVGYGTQKKSSLTGSIAQIDNKELMQAPTGNVSTLLAGRIAGLTAVQQSGVPGRDDATLMIRGISTLGDKSGPMIIVDGVPREFGNLDPNEIQSISILKDASAAAVYGMQAANGVILVTTKQGSEKKASVTYSGSFGIDENTRFPKFLDGPQYAYYWNKAMELDGKAPTFTESMFNSIKNGTNGFGNTNWVDQVFQTGQRQHHNISIDGGSKTTKYFISAGYYNQQGNVKAFEFDRYNFRSNISTQIGNNLTIGLNLGGRQENRKNPNMSAEDIVYQAVRMYPYLPMQVDGMNVGALPVYQLINPVSALSDGGKYKEQVNSLQSNLTIKWGVPFVEGLSLNSLLSYDYSAMMANRFFTPYQLMKATLGYNEITYTPEYTNTAGFLDPDTKEYVTTLEEAVSKSVRSTVQFSMNYARKFGDHDVTGLFLYEYSNYDYHGLGLTAQGFEFDDIHELNHSDKLKNSTGKSYYGKSDAIPRAGYVGRLTYGYKGKYLAEVSGRYDGSYKFSPENRWDFFPAASLGWRVSEEDFFKEAAPFVDNFKLRASWGKLGSDANVSPFQFYNYVQAMQTYPVVVIGGVPQKGYITSGVANPDLTWEVATSYNFGFDLNLWNNLLGIEFDVFYKKTTDILANQQGNFPASVGNYYPSIINYGVVDNRGIDLVITTQKRFGEVNFSARGTLNWARNKILRYNNSDIAYYQRNIGRSMGEKDGFIALGLFQSEEEIRNSALVGSNTLPGDIKYKDLNGDGIINYDQDRTWIGRSSTPEMMFGLNLAFDWRGFDFSALFQGAALCDQALMGFYPNIGWDDTQFTRPFYGGGNSPLELIENSWTPDNPNAKYPRLTTGYRYNSYANTMWLYDGAYVRLKNVQIGYTIPKSICKYIGAEQLRIYVTGQNLLTFSHNPFLDPEAPDVSNGYYPQQKNYTVGLTVTF